MSLTTLERSASQIERTLSRLYDGITQHRDKFMAKVQAHMNAMEQLIDSSNFPRCRIWINDWDINGVAFCLPGEEYELSHSAHHTCRGLARPIQRINFKKDKPYSSQYFAYVTVPGLMPGKKRALLKGILEIDNNGFKQEFIFDYDNEGRLIKIENFFQDKLVGIRTAEFNSQGLRIREEGIEYDLNGQVIRREKICLYETISTHQVTKYHKLSTDQSYTQIRTIACRQSNGKMELISKQRFTSCTSLEGGILGIRYPYNLLEYNTGILQLVSTGKYDTSSLSPIERNQCKQLDFTDPDAACLAMQNVLTTEQRARLLVLNEVAEPDDYAGSW